MKGGEKPVRIGIALSGGGARGFAHIGVIQELERLHVPVFCVAGASMGAVIGGWYAAKGSVDDLVRLLKKHPWRSFFEVRNVPQNLGAGGLFDMAKIEQELRRQVGNVNIEDLPTKFMTVATSIKTGGEVDLASGDLVDAICASGSMPFMFLPRKYGDDYLIDGGVMNNLPIDLCFRMGADIVLGSDVGYRFSDFNLIGEKGNVAFKPWEIYRVADALINLVGQSSVKFDPQDPNLRIVHPYVTHIATTDFDRMDDALFAGRQVMVSQEPELCDFLGIEKPQKDFLDQLHDFLAE